MSKPKTVAEIEREVADAKATFDKSALELEDKQRELQSALVAVSAAARAN
jgi:hypothetical protein